MSRKINALTDQEFEFLVKTLDAGVRAVGIDCVIDLAPVLLKISKAEHVDDSPAEVKPPAKKRTKRAVPAVATNIT